MFTQILQIANSITDTNIKLETFLHTKANILINELHNSGIDLSLEIKSDFFDMIFTEIEYDMNIMKKLDNILEHVEKYLDNLIELVPHYDETSSGVPNIDYEEEKEFEPYSQVYLDNLLLNVTEEELECYTSDNGALIMKCRKFIPPTTIYLNTLLNILKTLEVIFNNDEVNNIELYQCINKLYKFNIYFATYMEQLTL